MIDTICLFGTEEVDNEFLALIQNLPDKLKPDLIRRQPSEDAAERFIRLAMASAYLAEGRFYYTNIAAILFGLSQKEGFYDHLMQVKKTVNTDTVPKHARLLITSL